MKFKIENFWSFAAVAYIYLTNFDKQKLYKPKLFVKISDNYFTESCFLIEEKGAFGSKVW